jgi:multiple sugar transport system substrate-binding protein
MRRLLFAILTSLALAHPALAEPLELQIQLSWGRQANTQKVVADAFMKLHPDITVKFRPVTPDYTTGLETILRQSAVGQAPDITFQATNLMAQLVDRDLAVDLTPMLAEIPDLKAAGYTDSVLNLGRFNGRQYAMAFLIGSPVLYYNLDLVQRAGGDPTHLPATWEELIPLAARIRALGTNINGIYYSYLGDWQFQNLVSLMGSPMMDAARKQLLVDGPAGLAAMRMIGRFVTEGGMRSMSRTAAQEQFASGTLGILGDVGSIVGTYETRLVGRFPWVAVPLPDYAGVVSRGAVVGGNAAMILTHDKAKQRASWEYIRFATGPEGQTILTRVNGEPPLNTLALDGAHLGRFYDENPNYRAQLVQVQAGQPWFGFPGPNSAQITDTIGTAQESVVLGRATPDAAFAEMIRKVRALLP